MALIKKILSNGLVVFPATIIDAIKDAKSVIVDGRETNKYYGKTLRQIIEDNEKVTADALDELDERVGALTDLTTSDKDSIVDAINEIKSDLAGVPSDGVVSGHTTALETLQGTGEGSVSKTVADAVAQAKKDILTGGAEGTINAAYDTLKEVADWIASNDGNAATGLTKDVAALKTTVGDSDSGLVKKVADLENVGATKVEAGDTNGNIKIDGTETTVYTPEEGTVVDTNYAHITVSATDGVSDGTNTYKYTPETGTVVDENYAHITVSATGVSDGTNSFVGLVAVDSDDDTDYPDVFTVTVTD